MANTSIYAAFERMWQHTVTALNNSKPKAGFIYPLASEVVPNGFLLCDGGEYSRTEYLELFTAIGTIYGEGDGETTFNVPDLRMRVPVGADGGEYCLGRMDGEENHKLTVEEMPTHRHSIALTDESIDSDSATAYAQCAKNWSNTAYQGVSEANGAVGGNQSHNNMQPYTVLNYIIATGKDTAVSVADIILGAQAIPLGIEYGGTGATNAATARELLGALSKSGGTMTGTLDMGGNNILDCADFRTAYINGARIRAYDFGKDSVPFVLDRGGHCVYLVVGRTNSGVFVYVVRIDQNDSNPEVIKICGGEYASLGFTATATSLTINGSSYATCVVISIDNWNV